MRFVLVEPQLAGNVGAAARAMKNLGFRRLVLVRPHCDPWDEQAQRMARDARDLLHDSQACAGLDEALAGAATVVGTTRRRGKHRRPHWRLDRVRSELAALVRAGEVAVVFGREAYGLSDEELDRCTHLVYFPASAAYGSFNLAQSVLLVAYELRLALEAPPAEAEVLGPLATHEDRERMIEHLERALWAIGFLSRDSAEPMMRRLRRMLGKARLTTSEVQILHGIARQTLWLARKAGRWPEAPEP